MPNAVAAVIRPARVEDLDALATLTGSIQDLHHEARPDLFGPTDEQEFRQFLADRLADSLIVVAESDTGEVMGYLMAERQARPATPFHPALSFIYVHHIAVAQGARRTGVGERLMRWAIDLAEEETANAVRLDSWSFNRNAHEFFAAQGFTPMSVSFEHPTA